MNAVRPAAALLAAILLSFAAMPHASQAAGEGPPIVRITDSQATALGIEWVSPEAADPGARSWPATVVALPSDVQWIAAPAAGLVASIDVEASQRVAAGQRIASLHSAEVSTAAAEWLRVRSQASLAEREARRQRALVDEGVVPEVRARQAEAQAVQARAELSALAARLRLLGLGDREIARLRSGAGLPTSIELRTPTAGVVAELPVAAGQRVEAGVALARVVRTDRLALAIRVPAADASGLRGGAPVRDLEGRQVATLTAAPGAVSAAQTVELRARLAPGAHGWLLGQAVEVRLESGRRGWRLPRNSVFRFGDGHWVFVAADGELRPVAVEPQAGDGQHQVVLGSLDADSRVAAGNVAALKGAALGIGASGEAPPAEAAAPAAAGGAR